MSSPYLRLPVAALLAGTAGIHIALVPEHLREAPYAGVLFIALSAAALALALALAVRGALVVWTMAGALAMSAMLAYVASRWIGLPAMDDDVGDWLNPLGVAALVVESGAVLACSAALRALHRGDRRGLL
jgi:hypothetical protein